jgi:hypothetical protein
MSAHIISSGRSCGRAVFNLFLERFDGYFCNSINPEYSVYGETFAKRYKSCKIVIPRLDRGIQ